MLKLLFLSLFVTFVLATQNPPAPSDAAPVQVLSFKYTKGRKQLPREPTVETAAREMIKENTNFERNVRVNQPPGARDPNEDSLDGRRAALEKINQESRLPGGSVAKFLYETKVQNASRKTVEVIFWEYQFADPANQSLIVRRQFICGVNIKAGKEKLLQGASGSGPREVVNIENAALESSSLQSVLINRVEYSDGSLWQRKDWKFAEIRTSLHRALATPWTSEGCRGL